MWARFRQFWIQKGGNSEPEYEDAFWVPKGVSGNTQAIQLAVADGATETSFAKSWAKLLVWSYGKQEDSSDFFGEGLCHIRRIWKKCVSRQPLPWYAEAKLQMGAFSAVLCLRISKPPPENPDHGVWAALPVG